MRFYEVDSSVDAIMSAAMLAQTRASSSGKQGKLSINGFLQMLANAGIMMDYDGFKTVFDTNPQLKNGIAQFNKDEITFVGDSDDEGAGYEEPQGDMPDDERVAKMAQRATKMRTEEFVEGYEVLPKMDRDKYQERDGLVNMKGATLKRYGKNLAKKYPHLAPTVKSMMPTEDVDEAELPPHLSKMFGKDGSQVDTRTDVMKQMRDIVDNKSAMEVTFGDGKQMVDMYTASVLVQIYDKVSPENKEKIVQRVGTIEKFTKLMPKLFGMIGEGSSPHPKGSKKYKAHMAAKHANMNEVEDDLSDKIYAGIKAGMSKDEIISKYADKDNDPLLIDVMYSRIKFKMNEGKSVNEAWQAFNEAEEKSYTVVHAKHGKEVIKATSSYGAAKKYADMKKLKSTAGVDAHLMERDKT